MCSSAEKILPGITDLKTCLGCGFRTDFEFTNPSFRIPGKRYDFSITYDWASVVSQRFKTFCEESNYTGLRFVPLPKAKGFFHFLVDNILELDFKRIGLKREHLCGQCGQYREVFGLKTHYVVNLERPLPDGIWRSDVLIGSGNMKAPVAFLSGRRR